MERLSHYLDAKNEAEITSVVEKEMVESYMQKLVRMENSGLINMLMETMSLWLICISLLPLVLKHLNPVFGGPPFLFVYFC